MHVRCENLRVLHVSKHIHRCSNGEFREFPFYKMNNSDPIKRETKETEFIQFVRSFVGFNVHTGHINLSTDEEQQRRSSSKGVQLVENIGRVT